MASHPRQQIRKAVCAALMQKTDAQDRVYSTREIPWRTTDLPGIAVYTLSETSAVDLASDAHPLVLRRKLSLSILCLVTLTSAKGEYNVDDEMDKLSAQVEASMEKDPSFGLPDEMAVDSVLTQTEMEVQEEGRSLGAVRLTYEFTYLTSLT